MRTTVASLSQSRPCLGLLAAVVALASSTGALAAAHSAMHMISGANQQTTYGSDFPSSLAVQVTDAISHRAVSGVRVNFTAAPGVGVSLTSATTDEQGIARVTASGLIPCEASVIAQVAGSPATQVEFEGLVVNKATLTVLPTDLETKGGEAPEIASYSIVGFVKHETEETAHVSGVPELSTTATAESHYGNYAIKGGIGTLAAPNYIFVSGFGTLAISGSPDPASRANAANASAAQKDAITVRPALGKDVSMALLAGQSKDAAAPVRVAILLKAPADSVIAHAPIAPVAMPEAVASGSKAVVAPVRVALSHSDASPAAMAAHAAIAPAALPTVVMEIRGDAGVSARTAMGLNLPAAAAAGQSSYAGAAIRKALIVPGTN